MTRAGSAEYSPPALVVQTTNVAETIRLGRLLGPTLRDAVVVSIEGALGSGKTQLCKGMISGATGVDEAKVSSPAYTLINEYRRDGRYPLIHVDFYRLNDLNENDEALFDEAFSGNISAALVEWGDKFIDRFVHSYLRVRIHMSFDQPGLCTFAFDMVGNAKLEQGILESWRIACEHF